MWCSTLAWNLCFTFELLLNYLYLISRIISSYGDLGPPVLPQPVSTPSTLLYWLPRHPTVHSTHLQDLCSATPGLNSHVIIKMSFGSCPQHPPPTKLCSSCSSAEPLWTIKAFLLSVSSLLSFWVSRIMTPGLVIKIAFTRKDKTPWRLDSCYYLF